MATIDIETVPVTDEDASLPNAERIRSAWVSLAVVFFLAVLPNLTNALLTPPSEYGRDFGQTREDVMLIVMSLQVAVPVAYLISRSKESWAGFGITRFTRVDVVDGVGLTIANWILAGAASLAFASLLGPAPSEVSDYFARYTYTSIAAVALNALAMLCNSLAEEISMRSFFIVRMRLVTGSKWVALFGSSLLFASYHLYQGVAAALAVMVTGIVFGAYFLHRKRFWPLVIAHTITNLAVMWSS